MTIEQIVAKYNGKQIDANQFWPDGALDDRERIVELPWSENHRAFMKEMDNALELLDSDSVQHIANANDNSTRTFLYYAE
jgi:hypothetical protein